MKAYRFDPTVYGLICYLDQVAKAARSAVKNLDPLSPHYTRDLKILHCRARNFESWKSLIQYPNSLSVLSAAAKRAQATRQTIDNLRGLETQVRAIRTTLRRGTA